MRTLHLTPPLLLIAATSACLGATAPSGSLGGSWLSLGPTTPGDPYTTLTLTSAGSTVAGTAAEHAAWNGDVVSAATVSGQLAPSAHFNLTLQSGDTLVATYVGDIVDSKHLTGTWTYAGYPPFTRAFLRE